jgi:hypothetical protein
VCWEGCLRYAHPKAGAVQGAGAAALRDAVKQVCQPGQPRRTAVQHRPSIPPLQAARPANAGIKLTGPSALHVIHPLVDNTSSAPIPPQLALPLEVPQVLHALLRHERHHIPADTKSSACGAAACSVA